MERVTWQRTVDGLWNLRAASGHHKKVNSASKLRALGIESFPSQASDETTALANTWIANQ